MRMQRSRARLTSAASASRSSATARCRWSRAACWRNGMRADGRLTVYGAAKVAFLNRRVLAQQMGLPESAIRMVENDVGGGFGARGEFYPEDFLIPFAARLTGRPVKWIEDRREHLARHQSCAQRRVRAGDRLRARRHHPGRCAGTPSTDQGAYIRTNGPTAARNIAQVLTGPYRIPHVRIDVALMMTNKTPAGTYRGPGRYEADFFRERLFDIAAARARARSRRVPPAQSDRGKRAAVPARHRRAARHRDRDRQRRLRHDARRAASRRSTGRRRRPCKAS